MKKLTLIGLAALMLAGCFKPDTRLTDAQARLDKANDHYAVACYENGMLLGYMANKRGVPLTELQAWANAQPESPVKLFNAEQLKYLKTFNP